MNKICVYTICKNEAQFVERWLSSMNEADYVVVLDTGSTDGTFEMLKKDPRVFRVEQKAIIPWRFDVARNESMKLIPSDANILVCTDLDEVFDEGWADVLKKEWEEGYDQYWYKYHWSHDEEGNPLRTIYYSKIHNRDFTWKFPVHETLTYTKKGEPKLKNLFDSITLHHYPDNTKSRGSYLPLLEVRVEENPDDLIGKLYYGRELYFYQQYEKAIKVLFELSGQCDFVPLERAFVWYLIAKCYYERPDGDAKTAIEHAYTALAVEDKYRDPYLLIAQILWEKKMYYASIGVLKNCMNVSQRFNSWIEEDLSWNGRLEDIMALDCYGIRDYRNASLWCKAAIELDPTNERLQSNLKAIDAQLKQGENYGTN